MARQEGEEDSSTGLVIHRDRDWTNGLQSATDWVATTLPVISVAVIDEHAFTRECITRSLRECGDSLDVASFAACDDCLQSTRMHDLVLYHLHESVAHPRERVAHHGDDEARRACLRRLLKIAPVIILSGVDCPASIAEAFESGARGYIPTASTTVELAVAIMRLVRAGGTFVLQTSLSLQGTNPRGAPPQVITTHRCTPCEMEEATKIIAHELEVSESAFLAAKNSWLQRQLPTPLGLGGRPFVVGRQAAAGEGLPPCQPDLKLDDTAPFTLSRNHFMIENRDGGYQVRDLSSRLGTIVNGEPIGDHFCADNAPLRTGANEVIAGGVDSPFVFSVFIG